MGIWILLRKLAPQTNFKGPPLDFFAHGTSCEKVRKSALRRFRKKFSSAIESMEAIADIDVPEECLECFTLMIEGYQVSFRKIGSEQSNEKPRLRVV